MPCPHAREPAAEPAVTSLELTPLLRAHVAGARRAGAAGGEPAPSTGGSGGRRGRGVPATGGQPGLPAPPPGGDVGRRESAGRLFLQAKA